jgi:hypothetical protein
MIVPWLDAGAEDCLGVGSYRACRLQREGLPVIGKRWARVKVSEVWKGPKIENVEFLASPCREPWRSRLTGCDDADKSDAKMGETVLVFLTKEDRAGWVIMNKGQGRIPLQLSDGRAFTTHVPAGLPQIQVPDGTTGSNSAVELATLRDSAKKILQKTD